MDKELIERLAREAGWDVENGDVMSRDTVCGMPYDDTRTVARFAALIAEVCAKVVEGEEAIHATDLDGRYDDGVTHGCRKAAAAIRAKFGSTT